MLLKLQSPDYLFSGGRGSIIKGGAGSVPAWLAAAAVQDSGLEVPLSEPAPILVAIHDCQVTSRRSGSSRKVSLLVLSAQITAGEVTRGVATLDAGRHGFAAVAIEDADGKPSRTPPVIGIALDDFTVEREASGEGTVDMLLPPGRYLVYVVGARDARALIEVPERGDAGTTTIVVTR